MPGTWAKAADVAGVAWRAKLRAMPAMTLVILAGSVACDHAATTRSSATCKAAGSACASDAGVAPELDPQCNPDLSAYRLSRWSEPSAPSASDHATARTTGVGASFDFAPDLHSAAALTAWLTQDEPFSLVFELALGSQEQDPQTAYAVLLVDGLVQQLTSDNRAYDALPFALHPGDVVHHAVSVPAKAISKGAHSANLLLWTAHASRLANLDFTVLHDSVSLVSRPAPIAADIGPAVEGVGTAVRRTGSTFLLSGNQDRPATDGTLPLSFSVTWTTDYQCSQLTNRVLLVAFLDNRQVALGDLGVRPAVELHEQEEARFTTVVRGLPTDSDHHTFQIWQLTGDGAYSEAPAGESSPWWGFAQQVGRLSW